MLSRTAENLYWLARYMERADYVARLLQVAQRMTGLGAETPAQLNTEWTSTLIAAGCDEPFFQKYDLATPETVSEYLVTDRDNSSSILSCLETARRNARSVRTALTADMWDAVNGAWLDLQSQQPRTMAPDVLGPFLDWVKERTGLFNGAYANTMLRNEAFYFTRLGNFMERADNTARILDVKYHVLLPGADAVGGVLDYYQWTAILRAVSAVRSYHWIYPGRIQPWNVADLLILRPEMPRSLLFCYDQIAQNLDRISAAQNSARGEAHRLAGQIHAKLKYSRVNDILESGLHEFLTQFIDDTVELGGQISQQYLV
jgi:uncharacterized alpha-E superfamily protein